MTYLRYAPGIETPEPDEQKTIDGIIAGMTKESQTVEKREGHAVRASHAKSTSCVIGELTVADDLPPELAQGLFARGGTFHVAVRFAQGPGETARRPRLDASRHGDQGVRRRGREAARP